MVRDGIVFKDEDGQVIFNQHSFCELVKHLLVELVGISYEEASQIVDRSPLAEPVADAMGVAMFSHDLPYYWNVENYLKALPTLDIVQVQEIGMQSIEPTL